MEATVHFANLMDVFDLKQVPNLLNTFKNRKGEVCERTGHQKDTEQFSQCERRQLQTWQRHHVWILLSKLLGVAGEASHTISAYSQVKMTEAPPRPSLPPSHPQILSNRQKKNVERYGSGCPHNKSHKYGKDLQKGFYTGDS